MLGYMNAKRWRPRWRAATSRSSAAASSGCGKGRDLRAHAGLVSIAARLRQRHAAGAGQSARADLPSAARQLLRRCARRLSWPSWMRWSRSASASGRPAATRPRLFERGIRRIAQKVGEEGVETALAACRPGRCGTARRIGGPAVPPARAAARARACPCGRGAGAGATPRADRRIVVRSDASREGASVMPMSRLASLQYTRAAGSAHNWRDAPWKPSMRLIDPLLYCCWPCLRSRPPAPCNAGVVWEDGNGNGRIDPGEKPLAGIKVSDGVELVQTDAAGRYRCRWWTGARYSSSSRRATTCRSARMACRISGPISAPERDRPLKYGGIPSSSRTARISGFALRPAEARERGPLEDAGVLRHADEEPGRRRLLPARHRRAAGRQASAAHAGPDPGRRGRRRPVAVSRR